MKNNVAVCQYISLLLVVLTADAAILRIISTVHLLLSCCHAFRRENDSVL